MAAKRKVAKQPRLPEIPPIPLFDARAHSRLKAIALKYQVPAEQLRQALTTIYYDHRDSFALRKSGPKTDRWSRQKPGSKALKRSAAQIHAATKEYMSVLSAHPETLVDLLRQESPASANTDVRKTHDTNTFILSLNLILENSRIAKSVKAAPGRTSGSLAKTLGDKLGQLYDRLVPGKPQHRIQGESRGTLRIEFVQATLKLYGLDRSENSIRIDREKKHIRRPTSKTAR